MSASLINIITNIMAALVIIIEPIRAYLTSQTFNWTTFIICVITAVIGYFTSKSTLSTLPK